MWQNWIESQVSHSIASLVQHWNSLSAFKNSELKICRAKCNQEFNFALHSAKEIVPMKWFGDVDTINWRKTVFKSLHNVRKAFKSLENKSHWKKCCCIKNFYRLETYYLWDRYRSCVLNCSFIQRVGIEWRKEIFCVLQFINLISIRNFIIFFSQMK